MAKISPHHQQLISKVITHETRTVWCSDCGWTGPRKECGTDTLCDGIVDTCPRCGSDIKEVH